MKEAAGEIHDGTTWPIRWIVLIVFSGFFFSSIGTRSIIQFKKKIFKNNYIFIDVSTHETLIGGNWSL